MKYELKLNDRVFLVEVDLAAPMTEQEYRSYAPAPTAATAPVPAESAPTAVPALSALPSSDGTCVTSPMPGNILKVHVAPGQTVKEGDILVVLEAMKMENEIPAPKSGTVSQVPVSVGSTVETGTLLATIL